MNVIENYDQARSPQYCNAECKRERYALVRLGLKEPLTPQSVLKKKKAMYSKEKERERRAAKVKKTRGDAKLQQIKSFTTYEHQLWGKK